MQMFRLIYIIIVILKMFFKEKSAPAVRVSRPWLWVLSASFFFLGHLQQGDINRGKPPLAARRKMTTVSV
jgi:hypothetical protein